MRVALRDSCVLRNCQLYCESAREVTAIIDNVMYELIYASVTYKYLRK